MTSPGGDEDEEALLSQNYSDLIYAQGSGEEEGRRRTGSEIGFHFRKARDEEGDYCSCRWCHLNG